MISSDVSIRPHTLVQKGGTHQNSPLEMKLAVRVGLGLKCRRDSSILFVVTLPKCFHRPLSFMNKMEQWRELSTCADNVSGQT